MNTPMRVEYEVGYRDRFVFNLTHQFMTPSICGAFLILPLLMFLIELRTRPVIPSLVGASILFLVMWIAQAIFLAIVLITRRSDSVLTQHVLEADENALRDSTKFNESRYFWPGILKVVARPGFVAIYIAQHSALIIPSRAFPSRQERMQFVELIRESMHRPVAAAD
jgi:hypothetical protein